VVTSSARRPGAAIRSAATIMRATTASAAMETATATTAVTAAALRECLIWRESKTDENSKCEEGSKKTESTHNPYLPSNLGVQFRARSPCSRTARSYLIRFYSQARGCTQDPLVRFVTRINGIAASGRETIGCKWR